jgi:hypothetical protein
MISWLSLPLWGSTLLVGCVKNGLAQEQGVVRLMAFPARRRSVEETVPSCCEGVSGLHPIPGCAMFVNCANGAFEGNSMNCAPGTLFDVVTGVCNFEDQVTCEVADCSFPTAPPTLSPTTLSPAATSSPTSAPVESTGGCCPNDGLRPYDGCKSFFTCADGLVVGAVMSCPDDTLFDEENQACNFPSAFTCGPEDCIIPTQAPTPTPTPTLASSSPSSVTPVAGITANPVAPVDEGVETGTPTGAPAGAPTRATVGAPTRAPVVTSGVRLYELSLVVLPAVSVLLGLVF